MIKRLFPYLINLWWQSWLCMLASIVAMVLSIGTDWGFLERIADYLAYISLVGVVVSAIFQLYTRDWKGLTISSVFFIVWMIFMIPLSFILAFNPTDRYADDLKIPKDIPISELTEMDDYGEKRSDSMINMQVKDTTFVLYHSFQPGLFEYDIWLPKISGGTVYLKAFEITHNDPLSEDDVKRRSSVEVYNTSDTFKRFGTTSTFTIYEGDWGKPYAARFEVWYKPANGGAESMLCQRNYKIEGWER